METSKTHANTQQHNGHPCHYFNNWKACPFEELGCTLLQTFVGLVNHVKGDYAHSDIHRKKKKRRH